MNLEKIRTFFWIMSLVLFGFALFFPTYCTSVDCAEFGSSMVAFLFGWLGAIFIGSTYIAWFANLFFFASIFTNKKVPVLSLIFSIIAISFSLTLLKGGKILLNEAGHEAYITKLLLGYWLWLSSNISCFITALISVIDFRKKAITENNHNRF